MTTKNYLSNTTITGLLWGAVGGIALIAAAQLTPNGPLQVAPYPILLIAATLTVALAEKSNAALSKLVYSGFLTFIVMTICLYGYILTFINPNPGIDALGHVWRLAAAIGLGALSSLVVALIVRYIVK